MEMELYHNQTENPIDHGSGIPKLKYFISIQLKDETDLAENKLPAKILFSSK